MRSRSLASACAAVRARRRGLRRRGREGGRAPAVGVGRRGRVGRSAGGDPRERRPQRAPAHDDRGRDRGPDHRDLGRRGRHASKAGAVVIEIDPERRRLELAAGRAQLAQAAGRTSRTQRRQTERIRKLRSQNVASDQQLEAGRDRALARALARRGRSAPRSAWPSARCRRERDRAVRGLGRAALRAARRVRAAGQAALRARRARSDRGRVQPHRARLRARRARASSVDVARRRRSPTGVPRRGDVHLADASTRPRARCASRPRSTTPRGTCGRACSRAPTSASRRAAACVMVPEEAVLQRADGAVLFRSARDEPRRSASRSRPARPRDGPRRGARRRRAGRPRGARAATAGSSTARVVARARRPSRARSAAQTRRRGAKAPTL